MSKEAWVKWKVSNESAARIAVADFDNDGRLDFATIGYSVKGYYEAENPSICVFYNVFAPKKPTPISQLKSMTSAESAIHNPESNSKGNSKIE